MSELLETNNVMMFGQVLDMKNTPNRILTGISSGEGCTLFWNPGFGEVFLEMKNQHLQTKFKAHDAIDQSSYQFRIKENLNIKIRKYI